MHELAVTRRQERAGRKAPLAPAMAAACLKACTACGATCGKYAKMKQMVVCAKACAVCANICVRVGALS